MYSSLVGQKKDRNFFKKPDCLSDSSSRKLRGVNKVKKNKKNRIVLSDLLARKLGGSAE